MTTIRPRPITVAPRFALVLAGISGTLLADVLPDPFPSTTPDFRHLFIDAKALHEHAVSTIGSRGAGNLIIGDTPGEVWVVSDFQQLPADLLIINDGRVEITPTGTLRVAGDIQIFGNGTFIATDARIEFPQTYSYESEILIWEQGSLTFAGTTIDPNGHAFSMAVGSTVQWNDTEVSNGFATWGMFAGADVALTDVINAGEFVQIEASDLALTRCETVLFWLTLPDGSTVDTTLPMPGDVALFELNASTPWATGIPYIVRIEDCTESIWAVMARDGSSSTIRDSQIRVVGSIFEGTDTFEIVGLANGATLPDTSFTWGNINHHFINSVVETWNLYCWQQTTLTMRSSVFGELFSDDQSVVTVEQSICDGTGGHMHTNGQGQLFFLQSLCLSQITMDDNSFFIGASSSFINPIIDATDNSIAAFYNSSTTGDPRAHDSATIFTVAIDPINATQGDTAAVQGSAHIIKGPTSPLDFVSYSVEYLDDQSWTVIEGPITTPANNTGTIAQWDTSSVAPGQYPTRIAMIHTGGGDPIEAHSTAILSTPPCPADLIADGMLNFFDVSAFLQAFGANNPIADFTTDGIFNFFDVSAFLQAFANGCP